MGVRSLAPGRLKAGRPSRFTQSTVVPLTVRLGPGSPCPHGPSGRGAAVVRRGPPSGGASRLRTRLITMECVVVDGSRSLDGRSPSAVPVGRQFEPSTVPDGRYTVETPVVRGPIRLPVGTRRQSCRVTVFSLDVPLTIVLPLLSRRGRRHEIRRLNETSQDTGLAPEVSRSVLSTK